MCNLQQIVKKLRKCPFNNSDETATLLAFVINFQENVREIRASIGLHGIFLTSLMKYRQTVSQTLRVHALQISHAGASDARYVPYRCSYREAVSVNFR